ncbi:MAG: hypothetical protein KF812_12770 [Fimbriimonadaceae bacterium]|nr:hypothetical protein [Fimbriimonadaceae bacterium]
MQLRVPFSDFADACARHDARHVYLAISARGTECTAPTTGGWLVLASEPESLESVHAHLEQAGLTCSSGGVDQIGPALPPLWVCGVAYRSREETPGLWLDVRSSEPTVGEVLERFFAELSEDGELVGLTLEEFIRLTHPNVIIVPPGEVADFVERA